MQTAKRILLVEDDTDDQEFFTEALHTIHPSIQCAIANNGEEALDIVSKPPLYDIIFLDLNMPKMGGFEFLRILKGSNHKDIPVVILSTSDNPKDIAQSKKLGAAMYCVKPTSYDDLFEELKTIVTKGIKFHSS